MNHLKHLLLFLIITIFLTSCASYQSKLQTAAITFPELGSLINVKDNLLFESEEQIGILNFDEELLVSTMELPFNKASYTKYLNYLEKANRVNSVSYTDSMPYKPKYIRLQLLDKIALTELLNNDNNKGVRSYLENDADYKLVTSLDVTVTDELRSVLMESETILLQKDTKNKLLIYVINNNQKRRIDFSHLEVFDFNYVSFCWGEDRYHQKLIKALVQENESCPKNTYSRASKVKSKIKSFSKL